MNTQTQQTEIVLICISDNPHVPDLNPANVSRLAKLTNRELNYAPAATQSFTFSDFSNSNFFKELQTPGHGNGNFVFEYACGFRTFPTLREIAWDKIPAFALSIEFEGMSRVDARNLVKLLKVSGWRRTGIGIRATGTDSLFLPKSGNNPSRVRVVQETRRTSGRAFVRIRDSLGDLTNFQFSQRTPINPQGKGFTQFNVRESEAIASTLNARSSIQFHVPVPENNNQYDLAAECFQRFGVRPISFSFPEKLAREPIPPINPVSSVIPGHAYSYESPEDYFRQYSESALAITHRKAGWDCFRHVEILAAGSVPLMLDSEQIPKFSMTHYPKSALTQVAEIVKKTSGTPDQATQIALHRYFKQNLTTEAMANYLMESAGFPDAQKILFVDQALPQMADYQSVLTLIGLKEIFGEHCHVAFPVDYIYSDWAGSPQQLYGRGFGYSRGVESDTRSSLELDQSADQRPALLDRFSLAKFDAVVVGSLARNSDLAFELLTHFPAEKTIWVHGEDTPPDRNIFSLITSSQTHSFIRSLNA